MITWNDLYKAAAKAGFETEVMACEENANDTIFIEKEADADQFDDIAMRTLEERLACGMASPAAVEFFERMGVRY